MKLNAAGRLEDLANDLASTGADVSFAFAHNAAGQAVSFDRDTDNSAYVWPQPALATDNYTPNGRNQIASRNAVSFTHDGRGNLTGDGARTFAYDVYNRLTGVSGSASLTLGYDPAGRLYETNASSVTTRFLYDGPSLIGEFNGSGTLLRRYVHGPGIDEPLVWYEGSGTSDRRWLTQDRLGSVIAATDASGAALSINSYDEYGVPAASNQGRFQYTGQMYLPEAQLHHYRARAYDPALGRFLQSDPILYAGGLNLYAYVQNDPINATDPFGLQDQERPPGDPPVIVYPPNTVNGLPVSDTWHVDPSAVYWAPASPYTPTRRTEYDPPEEPRECPTSGSLSRSAPAQLGAVGLGIGDAFSFGAYSELLGRLPGEWGATYRAERELAGYNVGLWGSGAIGGLRLTYSGIATSLRFLPGQQAVEARNALKGTFSGLGPFHPRMHTYEQSLSRYGSDSAVSAAAARTNPELNTAAGVAVASVASQEATGNNAPQC